FLDEIGELSLALQAKLLRVLQYGDIQRVGDDRSLRVDVRVLAATNRDLREEVLAGRFRADLFHRPSGFPLFLAPPHQRCPLYTPDAAADKPGGGSRGGPAHYKK
ncbi:hypothetical protein SE11_22805, partial [Salmonella enterica subsp. enterica serovar Braenderup]|uniref:sigma 54-interacting transcriptional regulator n=1 Tax=Salmonella enterica TaxID=28901 RepID=UPI000DC4ADA3